MRTIHTLIPLILLTLLSSCGTIQSNNSKALEIETIRPKYMEHKDFISINEYLTGKETSKNRLIIRSKEATRSGLYLVLKLNDKIKNLPPDTNIICEIFMPGKLNPEIFEFPLPRVNKLPNNKDLFLGITGSDWPYGIEALPTAWKITFVDSNGTTIAEKSSQVWSL